MKPFRHRENRTALDRAHKITLQHSLQGINAATKELHRIATKGNVTQPTIHRTATKGNVTQPTKELHRTATKGNVITATREQYNAATKENAIQPQGRITTQPTKE